jgi:hypothetical protein
MCSGNKPYRLIFIGISINLAAVPSNINRQPGSYQKTGLRHYLFRPHYLVLGGILIRYCGKNYDFLDRNGSRRVHGQDKIDTTCHVERLLCGGGLNSSSRPKAALKIPLILKNVPTFRCCSDLNLMGLI